MPEFTVDNRVIFKNNIYDYEVCDEDPKWDSEFACIGTINSMDFDEDVITRVYVSWDNGCNNNYDPDCLELVDEFLEKFPPEEIEIPSLTDILGE